MTETIRPPGKRPLQRAILFTALVLLGVLTAGGYLYFRPPAFAEAKTEAKAPQGRPAMPVEVTEVTFASADRRVDAVGTLLSNESVTISAEIAGRIDKIAFAEGQAIAGGKPLIGLDSSVLKAELDRAEANRALHRANYKRAEALLADHAISERERDEAYAQWMLDEANLRLAQAQLDKTLIRAPFAGTLGLRHVSLGDYVKAGQALVNLEDIAVLKVEFRIPEKFSALVKTGQRVELTSDAYPGKSFEGSLYAINPLVEEETRSLVVRALLQNRDGLLRPGQFVKVALTVDTRENALFIPEQALISQPKTRFVYKVVDGAAAMVPVQIGVRRKGWVEVTVGLAAGDRVITGGHQKIGPGSPVRPMPADPALFVRID